MSSIREVFPYLRIRGAAEAIAFYQRAFGATELMRLTATEGRIGHAEIRIGGATLMLADEHPEIGVVGPQTLGGTSVAMHLHVEDIDGLVRQAVEAGATVV